MNPDVVGQANVDHFRSYLDAIAERLAKPLVLADVDGRRYDAIVIPGGHGPVEDLYKDPDMGRILLEADTAGILIAPVCHGQAALLAARGSDGNWPFAGRAMTSFSDEEEVELGTADNAPWLLADTLRKSGARYEKGPNWAAYVVRDGNLLTGQNPASSAPRRRRVGGASLNDLSLRGRRHADPALACGRLRTVGFYAFTGESCLLISQGQHDQCRIRRSQTRNASITARSPAERCLRAG